MNSSDRRTLFFMMDNHYNPVTGDDSYNYGRNIIMHSLYLPKLSAWLDLKVFYVRVSNCEVDESTPDHITLNHIPLTPDTILEVNGRRSSIYSECVSSVLRRDRMDKRSEEATFVSTDSISMTGSVRFEVHARDDMLISGVLELSKVNGCTGNGNGVAKKWKMKCQPVLSDGRSCFLKDKKHQSPDMALPTVDVYVAGYFSGAPIILTKTLQIGVPKKHHVKIMLDSIPEDESTEPKEKVPTKDTLQLSKYNDFTPEHDVDIDNKSVYSRVEYFEGEDWELSWFNAGVRVGVGLGLGICLGIGVGVGLLVRTYHTTTRNFNGRLI